MKYFVVEKIDALLCAKTFAICSTITTIFGLVLLRVLLGGVLNIGDSIDDAMGGAGSLVENFALGRALSISLMVMAPIAFCSGFASGYAFGILYNQIGGSTDLIKVREDSIRFK